VTGVPLAHGIVGRTDLPIPEELFVFMAVVVLLVSFVALAVLWPTPRLQDGGFRPLPRTVSAILSSHVVEMVCGALGVCLLALVVWSGIVGVQSETANFAPTFVLVIVWVGLVPASVALGDVFRAFNPWRAIGRATAFVAQTAARGPLPAPLRYPERLGYWPAAAGILAFATLELVAADGTRPEMLAIATLVYSAVTFIAMALYGVDAWCERGEAFGAYFGLFARMSPVGRQAGRLGIRVPLSGLTGWGELPGAVALLAVMIGTVTFDGLSEAPSWTSLVPHLTSVFEALGASPQRALELAFFVGLVGAIAIVLGFYRLGALGMQTVGGGHATAELARRFVHSLVPIALAYVTAHYLTYLVFNGQAISYLVSNPLGREGTDLFGTANDAIDYSVLGATATWYLQVAFVVVGHVAALVLAHDKALVVYGHTRLAVVSQYWMLTVMVGFTSLALWLLSQSNA